MLTGRKLPLTLAFVVLIGLAIGAGCKGFFVKPVLQSIAIQPPTPQILLTKTVNLQAFGVYDDGTRSQITSGVVWSSDSTNVTIDPNTGVATGAAVGPATITASAQAINGTANATVYIVITSLTVNPNTWSFLGVNGDADKPFTATANGNVDVTSGATFTSSNTTFINCVNGTSPVLCTAVANTTPGPYTITVSYPGSTITATVNVTAN